MQGANHHRLHSSSAAEAHQATSAHLQRPAHFLTRRTRAPDGAAVGARGAEGKRAPRENMSCAHCGKPGAVKGCSACKTTRYCDEDCQRAHWALHKGPCKETKRAAALASAAPPPPPQPPAGPFVLDLHCGHCGAELAYDVGNKRCGACNRVGYCGKACQKAHWAVHKEACGAATRARVHAGEGELEGAEGTLKRAMEKAQRKQGEESSEALGHMNTYAVFLQRVARFEEAGTLFRKVLEVRRRTLGDSHPDTLASIGNMASLLQA